jgi:hypothetical protein
VSRAGRGFARIVLALSALPFLGIGAGFLLAPASMAANVDVALGSATAASDVRAVYGGLQLALGALLAACALSPAHARAGLVLQVATFAGLALGRLVSLPIDGVPSPFGALLFAAELVGLALGVGALRYLGRSLPFQSAKSAG